MNLEVENSSGNVFADLGLDDAEELYTRAALVVMMLKERGYTQAEAATCLEIQQPEVSALLCARFHRFSQERSSSTSKSLCKLVVTTRANRFSKFVWRCSHAGEQLQNAVAKNPPAANHSPCQVLSAGQAGLSPSSVENFWVAPTSHDHSAAKFRRRG